MKTYKEHLADVYLLLNDILENQYAQKPGHKSRFYYAFNPHLPYTKARGDHLSQLMLLQQLANMEVLSFEAKEPASDLPASFLSANARHFVGQRFLLNIDALALDKMLKQLKKYGQQASVKRKRSSMSAEFGLDGTLSVAGFDIKFQANAAMYDMLRAILTDRETRLQDWSYSDMREHVSKPAAMDENIFMRNTGNNINRRVAKATNGAIAKLMNVTTESVHLDSRFV